MFFTQADVELPGHIPFKWTCTYYSTSERQGPLGYGWHHSYDLALWPDAAYGTVAMRLGDGRLVIFDAPSSENEFYSYYRAHQLELWPAPDGSDGYAVYSVRERCTYHFVPSPARPGQYHLLAIDDSYGHALTFAYAAQGHLIGITDSVGRAIVVHSDPGGRILALDLPQPAGTGSFAAVRYGYDAQGHLTSRTNAEGHTRHFRYEGHRLVQKTFATGMSFYYEYDEQGRCTRTWGDENYYNGRLVYAPNCTTVYTDDPQAVDTYYHEQGMATSHLNALGHTHQWHYNQYLELEEEQDALGRITRYTYDARGNATSVTYPDGATGQTQYNHHDQPAITTDANGHQWQWRYDEKGELMERTDPTGASTSYRYNEQGQLVELLDALGHPTRLRYDSQHNLVHLISPDGNIRSRLYDALGRLVELTDALGTKQRRRYDRLGQVIAMQLPDGQLAQLAYDGEGNVVLASKNEQEVAFAYTAVNRLAQRRQAGQQLTFAYDREAWLVGLTNEQGHHYRFELDAAGRVVTETGFDGLVRHYERDAAGQVARVQRPAGRTTAYRYDAAGRVAEVDYNDGQPITYRYDGAGALLAARTATSSVEFERDALGRVIQEKQGAHTLSYRYDARGQRISLISSLGADFSWQHDAMGNLSAVRAGEHWQAHFLHDARGLELQRQCSGGIRLAWSHDAAGRPTSQHIATRQGPVRQRQYQWQGADQLTQIEDSLTGSTQYSYDAIGTLTGARYADGSQDVRLADAFGNLFRTPTLADRQYAPGGQLHQASGTRYRYDEEGNLTQKTTADGQQWRYSWDGGGQLASVGLPSGYTVTFGYDALGRRTSKRYRGRVTRWVCEGNVPLHEWTELAVGPEAGSASEVLTWLFEEGSFAPAAKLTPQAVYSVVADHLGTPLALYNGQGKPTWQAQLDSSGGVRQGRGQAQDCPFHYQGQYEDVETGLYYNRFRYYDPEMGQYISQDPIGLLGGRNLYGYVSNCAERVDPLGLAPWAPGGFGAWFDQATPAQVLANKSSVSAALRGEGGMHEMFPVSMAAKARELGFTHAELMDMTMPRDQVWFENVPGRPGDIHAGPRSTGAVLPEGQSSKASSWFHKNLEAELRNATSKEQARAIIEAHHGRHAISNSCG